MNLESESAPKAPRPFSLRGRIASFGHAFRGIANVIRFEHNAWIHALATLFAISMGIGLAIGRMDWLAVILAITMVWMAEAFNTAIEALCDVVSPEHDPRVKSAKDAAAGAVLLSSLGALAVGLFVFGPRLLFLLARLGGD